MAVGAESSMIGQRTVGHPPTSTTKALVLAAVNTSFTLGEDQNNCTSKRVKTYFKLLLTFSIVTGKLIMYYRGKFLCHNRESQQLFPLRLSAFLSTLDKQIIMSNYYSFESNGQTDERRRRNYTGSVTTLAEEP